MQKLMSLCRVNLVVCLLTTPLAPAMAAPGSDLQSAITGGKASVDARLRFEHAEQDNGSEDADALTLRMRLGYLTGKWQSFDAFAEYEGVYAIGGDDNYNSGPPFLDNTNDNTSFATIADPTGDEVNRAWLRYSGLADTAIKLGRQRLILDNARFFGNVGWRNDEQTFNAASLVNTALPNTTLTYAYLRRNNFIFFNENKLDAHLLHAHWAADERLNLSAYTYLVDFREDNNPRVPGTPDHLIAGLRATGKLKPVGYTVEYAKQSDYADSSSVVDADYYLIELFTTLVPVTPKLGYEVLGGDGSFGFSTPFGTNHAFQGWADVFLNTPANGIRDAYASLSAKAGKVKFAAVYHDFQSDEGNLDYGSEINLLVAGPVTGKLGLLFKFADYNADDFAADTRRYWLQAQFKF